MQFYIIEPLDILLFREAKPFSPAEGSWAKGIFPPLPITVFQALRSTIDASESENNRRFQFIGPFLLYEEPGEKPELWLPTPKDLLCINTKKNDDEQEEISESNYKDKSIEWERLVCLQPLDCNHEIWSSLGFDLEYFPENGLVPMIPPTASPLEANATSLNHRSHNEYISGRPQPWIKASALVKYLQGESLIDASDFHHDPWSLQVLSHIQMQSDKRQVKTEDGYFTEVAVRLHKYWKLVAGIDTQIEETTVRLGGEGHRALVYPLDELPMWDEIQSFAETSDSKGNKAYLVTPGLAQSHPTELIYGVFPYAWREQLLGCVSDRPILYGGKSVYQKRPMLPQRAFVPPGTVYRFQRDFQQCSQSVLPSVGGKWLQTLQSLNYGKLLWSR
ncbi:MAG: CRISPR-associated protein [Richelia sp. RM2_1_2]|nr:CRISPR-associated protein [Richelia sp. SM1_7_0]NJN13027.1 CRISPR-associated protein [Richelia sp. RM1_1_1]NJO63489.1 CRISPR-associated protein [Richelia sp. RM2_1_2]